MTQSIEATNRDRTYVGIILILFSTFMTASQDATFKFASSSLTIWQIFSIRSALLIPALLLVAPLFKTAGASWADALKPWPIVRSILFVMMYFSMFPVLPFLKLAVVAAGLYTAPLWVAILSPVFLSDKVTLRTILAVVLGFCGALVNLRPTSADFSWIVMLPILAGLFYALSAIVTRSKCREIAPPALAISLAMTLFVTGILGSLAVYFFQPSATTTSISPFLLATWAPLGPLEWKVIGVLTLLMFVNGLVLPIAYQSAPTTVVATFDYFYLIFSPLLGFLIFSEIPDFYTILGMCMIAAAGLIIAQGEYQS